MKDRKILITGASGFIGGFLVEEALRRGYETWAGIRAGSSKAHLQDKRIHFIDLKYGDQEALTAQLSDFAREHGAWDYVIHNAGLTKTLDKRNFFRVNAENTHRFIEALAAAGCKPKKFLLMSSLSSYGRGDEKTFRPIRLDDPQRPDTAYGQSKLEAENYIRKQTLANAERYITEELKNLENMILGAEDKLYALEYELFSNVRDKVGQEVIRIQRTAKAIAGLDVFASLALVAERNHYVRPKVNEGGIIDIKGGRHPVVEQMIDNDMFIANDTYLDNTKKRVSIITGPNMAGKSTYMRQTALIVLMAQIGSFVPADKAVVGIVDRIFTRVGASDDLASGQSTFMVEMTEVANILRNATAKSLLILDEIGRGTSTFDGLAIAWAVIEHISNTKLCGAKTLFATHYHELTELEGKLSGVTNYCIAVKEKGDDIVFLRKIVKGGADKSYGIQVAKLAGVPDSVINRAKELVEELSDADITAAVKDLASPKKKPKVEMDMAQMSLFDTVQDNDIIEELKGIDIGNLTPMEALNTLYNLQNKIKNRW